MGGYIFNYDLWGARRLSLSTRYVEWSELCGDMDIKSEIRPITADEMRNADEVFLATTAGGIMPASRIDGRIMGNDRPGPISARLREAFWKRRAEGWHATPIKGLPPA